MSPSLRTLLVVSMMTFSAAQAGVPIQISTFAQLDSIRHGLAGEYVLVNNIDASATADPGYNGGQGWVPLGRDGATVVPFTGTFDGQGFAITGLTIALPSDVWHRSLAGNDGYPFHRWQTARHTLQYAAAENGSLAGDLDQVRIPGVSGAPVTATPDQGFVFQRWSDGSTENPRRDLKVMSDLGVSALFIEHVTPGWSTF